MRLTSFAHPLSFRRSRQHVNVPAPIAVNGKVYFVTMIGTVYVVNADVETFDGTALQ